MNETITRQCHACKATKPINEFTSDKNQPLGKGYRCSQCSRDRMRQWRKNNPKKHSAAVSAWQKAHPRPKEVNAAFARKWRKNNPERARAIHKKYRDKNPGRFSDYRLNKMYGLPPGSYDKMLAAQGGRCAICKSDTPSGRGKRFHVDHCHETQRVRALLCHHCNCAIGHLNHDPKLLQAAIDYLATH